MRWPGFLVALWETVRRRGLLRKELRRRMREATRPSVEGWNVDPQQLKEMERLERMYELEGRWLPRPWVLMALWLLLVTLALGSVACRWPFSTAASLALTTTEVAVQPAAVVSMPRMEEVSEISVSGLAEARGDDGVWSAVPSVHLRSREGGRLVIEPFELRSRGPARWLWTAGEASVIWQADETRDSATGGLLVVALRGPIEGQLTSAGRTDVRRVELRPEAGRDVRLSWRPWPGASPVEYLPFDVDSMDLLRVHPAAEGNRIVSGLVSGDLVVPARSLEALRLGFREELRLGFERGRIVGLRLTPRGWQFRWHGQVDSLSVGPHPGRNLVPNWYQQAEATPWMRQGFAALTLLLSVATFLWSVAWR